MIWSWSVIRKATEEDYERVEASAQRFAARHNIDIEDYDDNGAGNAIEWLVENDPYLRSLWKNCLRRAVRDPRADGIASGYVGFHVD